MKSVQIFLAIFIAPLLGISQNFETRFTTDIDRSGENYSVYEVGGKIVGIRSARKKIISNNREGEFFILNDELQPETQITFPMPDHQEFQWADIFGPELVLLSHYSLKVIQSTIDELAIISIDSDSGQLSIIPFKSSELSEVTDFYSFGMNSLIFGRNAAGLMLQSVDHLQPEKIDRKILFDNSFQVLSVNKQNDAESLVVLARKKDAQQNDLLHMVTVSPKGEIIEKGTFDLLEDKRTNYRTLLATDFKGDKVYSGVFGPRNNYHSSGLINIFINEFEEFSLWRSYLNDLPGFFDEHDSTIPFGKKKRMDRRVKTGRIPYLKETLELWGLETSENGVWHHFGQFGSQLKSESDYQRSFIESFTKKNKYFAGNRFSRELPQVPGAYKDRTRPYRLSSEYIAYAAHLIHVNDKQEITQYHRIPLSATMQFLPTASGAFSEDRGNIKYAYFDGKDILCSYFENHETKYLNKKIPFDHDQKTVELSSIQVLFDQNGSLLVSGKGRLKDKEGSRKTAFFIERYSL